jgi:Predicted metal-dependent hydrolase of the TIM-barrel fold
MRIIDCHCHAGKGNGLSGPWDTSAPLSRFLKWSDKAGIQQTNLFAAFHTDGYAKANAEVAKIVGAKPGRFFGFAFVHSEADRGKVRSMVETAVRSYGFCGIKAHRHDARLTREVCEAAAEFQLPVLYDVMGEVSAVELLATEYPSVNFIIPHLGSFADDWKAQIHFLPMLERHPNVYTDSSGIRRFDLLESAVKRAGPEKVLFGTDGPWLHPAVELQKIYALELPPRETQMILADNFLRLTWAARGMKASMVSEVVRFP